MELATQICEGLKTGHLKGTVHRDVESGNVLVTGEGQAKILDFGLAKKPGQETLPREGAVAGTPGYMAPEQMRGETADRRTDIWAVGAVLHEMLTGRLPMGQSEVLPEGLDRVVRKALAADPGERYQHVEDMLVDVRAVRTGAQRPVRTVSRRRWLVVAVLPFANLNGDPEQEYLSDGLTQEMISQLGGLHPASLSVIARTSVMRYKNSEKPVDEVGRELDVDYILEGSARREGGRIRITAEQARLANVRQVFPEAYETYLRGMQQFYKLTRDGFDAAEVHFGMALATDPSYALAHVGVSLVWAGRQQMGLVPPLEAAPRFRAAIARAVALDNALPEVHFALAGIKTWTDRDWAGAEQEFKRAIDLNPSFPDARAYYSHLLMFLLRNGEAEEQMALAVRMDPFNPLWIALYARILLSQRRYDEAIAQARSALRLAPDLGAAHTALLIALHQQGMEAEAVAFRREHLTGPQLDAFEQGYREAGYRGAWRRLADYLVRLSQQVHVGPVGIARAYNKAEEKALCLDWLDRAFELRDPNLPYEFTSPEYEAIRSEPRFQALRSKMNLPG